MSKAPRLRRTFSLSTAIAAAVVASCAGADEGCVPTAADSLGPYYVAGTAITENLNRLGKPGEPLTVIGSVLSAAAEHPPIANAQIEIWQTDGEGDYHPAGDGHVSDYDDSAVDMRGTVITDGSGVYQFATVVPGGYFPRPRHFHYRIAAPDHATLVTQLYVTGDGALRQPGEPCRHASIEETDAGLRYAAPNIYLLPE